MTQHKHTTNYSYPLAPFYFCIYYPEEKKKYIKLSNTSINKKEKKNPKKLKNKTTRIEKKEEDKNKGQIII